MNKFKLPRGATFRGNLFFARISLSKQLRTVPDRAKMIGHTLLLVFDD